MEISRLVFAFEMTNTPADESDIKQLNQRIDTLYTCLDDLYESINVLFKAILELKTLQAVKELDDTCHTCNENWANCKCIENGFNLT